MPGKIKVKVLAGRNLPVMDRASDTTDAFVEIKFGGVTHKTDVCRKSLNPHWNSTEWYRFEVDESELQDEPLQLRLMDHDTYSANDAIGKVVISLAPLLARESAQAIKGTAATPGGAVMSGWIPVMDTMHGIRGELNVIVKVELFTDFNKYKTSSVGVQFFHCPQIPPGYRATSVHGFVEELVVNDDPEYQWIDKIRTPRASNEARQVAFIKLSNQVQRLVGLKAAELGANAVVGYQQDFDLEGEAGVVARAIGTAVSITPVPTLSQPAAVPPCTQQQLKKYLDILSTDSENITDLNEYFTTHQEELKKLVSILHPKSSSDFLDDPENDNEDQNTRLTRHSSVKSYTDSVSIYQDDYALQNSFKNLTEDQTDLNRLLNRKDEDSESDSSGPLQTIKKIKTNFFVRRLGSLRSRKDKPNDDQISIKSNSSDTSKISLTDFKNEFKKRIKKPKFKKQFKNMEDEGVGMASILARSVIHAHTSLACIAETQDSEPSPCSTLRRTSESEPTINLTDEEKIQPQIVTETIEENSEDSPKTANDMRSASLTHINIKTVSDGQVKRERRISESCPNTPVAKRQENLLRLPENPGYFDSISSALSGESSEIYSSSDEDDESSDLKTDTDKSLETTSYVVQTVMAHDAKSSQPKTEISKIPKEKSRKQSREEMAAIASTSAPKCLETFVNEKPNHHHFKFHNPFTHKNKSISAPSSPVEKRENFVYRSSKRIKRQLSKLSNSSMIKSLSHYSLLPKKKEIKPAMSPADQSSSSDVPSKAPSHDTVLGSPFLSYTDLLSLDKDVADLNKVFHRSDEIPQSKVEMYIGSEPVSRASISGPSSVYHGREDHQLHEHKFLRKEKHPAVKPVGLIHTAMETILIDKVQSLLITTTPTLNIRKQKFFDDVSHKLEIVEEAQKNKNIIEKESFIESNQVSIKPKGDDNNIEKVEEKDSLPHVSEHTDIKSEIIYENETKPSTVDGNVLKANLTHEKDLNSASTDQLTTIKKKNSNANLPHEKDPITDEKDQNITETLSNIKKLKRQDSIHSLTDEPSHKMSKSSEPNIVIPCKSLTHNAPTLQHFHPIKSGIPLLESIPSLPENSFDQSLDIEGVPESDQCSELNSVSVCDNTHAACLPVVGRSEREKEKEKEIEKGSPKHTRHESYTKEAVTPNAQNTSLNAASTPVGMHRRSSDSDLSITPKGSSLNASGNAGSGGGAILRPSMNSNNLDLLEYPFLTMAEYPPGFIVHIGGCVCARSVKLVDGGGESATRAAWWAELRTEIRAHARALRCNIVLAYTELTAICEDVCVLSASGTAAVINLDCDYNADIDAALAHNGSKSMIEEVEPQNCGIAHVPYSPGSGPAAAELSHCGGCRRSRVPSVLLATCSKPNRLASYGKAVPLTAVAARVRRAPPQSEPGARDISDQLPFLEYELHKLLLAKLRMQGANALFNLQTQIAIGERCVIALASGTAVRLAALPPPTPPRIKASEKDKDAIEIQKALWDAFTSNKAANGYDGVPEHGTIGVTPVPETEERPILELCADKDTALLELDEAEDVETAKSLAARRQHMPIFCHNMKAKIGKPPQSFVQVCRFRFPLGSGGGASVTLAERHVARALDAVTYKLRRLRPVALLQPRYQLELPEDEIQLVLSGAAIQLQDPTKPEPSSNGTHVAHGTHGDDEIFALDEEQSEKVGVTVEEKGVLIGQVPTSVSLTTLSYISGARIVRRVCALRLLFVRETTAVRELGGLSGFLHTFTCEVMAIVRAYTVALGGNTLTSFYIRQLMLQDNAHKNQGQCLLSVGGDVVHITY